MTRVVSIPTVVVLPAPFGPRSPKISPWRTSRSSSSTATTPVGYVLDSFSVRMTASGMRQLLLSIARRQRVDVGAQLHGDAPDDLALATAVALPARLARRGDPLAEPPMGLRARAREGDEDRAPVRGIPLAGDEAVR